jgi:hypothetical protein
MSKTDVFEVDLLKLMTGKTTTMFTSTPITPFIGLQTAVASDASEGTEASGNAYARQAAASAVWATPAAGSVANVAAILFPAATPAGYTVVGGSLHSASSAAGNMLRWAAITSTALAIGDQLNFAIGAITFTED